MITKDQLQEQLEFLGNEFSFDELLDRILIIEKINIGLNQSQQNLLLNEDELDSQIEKW